MNKDKDIRNFFASSGKKETENKSVTIKANYAQVETKQKEEILKINLNENKPEKEKKSRKRKGAQMDKEDKEETGNTNLEVITKKKKTTNKKDKESTQIVENPIPMEVETVELVKPIIEPKVIKIKENTNKRNSRSKKIIDDEDEDEELPVIQAEHIPIASNSNSSNLPIQTREVLFKNSNDNRINNTSKPNFPVLNKPKEKPKLVKVDASNFFNINPKVEVALEETKQQEQVIPISNIDNNEEPSHSKMSGREIIPLKNNDDPSHSKVSDREIIPVQNEDDMMLDINDLDLEELAKDLFPSEEKRREDNICKQQMESLKISENVKTKVVELNSILSHRTAVTNNNIAYQNIPSNINIHNNNNINNNNNPNNNIQAQTTKVKAALITPNPVPIKAPTNNNNILWTTKYTPLNIEDIIGNQGTVKKLMDWLQHWDDSVIRGLKREVDFSSANSNYTRGKSKIENLNARACMISGPPGIGKTTTVRLVASKLNYRTYELNASDQRNKQIITSKVGYLMDNTTITKNCISEKNLIIMDEVDGMGGNEDKGGISALIEIVKKTKLPIICICNDLQNQKLRSLLNHCYELKFTKPEKRSITTRLMEICKKEGMNINHESVEFLCESTGNDIRQCLNFLELKSRSKKNNQTSDEFKSNYIKYGKDEDIMINAFDSCKKMLTRNDFKILSFRDKMDLFFIDFDLLPSLIHENYLSCYGNNRTLSDLRRLAVSSENISLGDVIDRKIRTNGDWNLLPNRGICSCVTPALLSGGFLTFTKFPELFGKISKMRKVQRQLKEFKAIFPSSSLRTIKEEIAPVIFSKIVNKLIENAKEGVEKVVNILTTYKINLLLFKENLFDLQSSEFMLKKYDKLNPSVKSMLTKKLNEEFKTSITKKNKKEVISVQKTDAEGNFVEEGSEGEDENEEEGEDQIQQVKEAKKTTKKTTSRKK